MHSMEDFGLGLTGDCLVANADTSQIIIYSPPYVDRIWLCVC